MATTSSRQRTSSSLDTENRIQNGSLFSAMAVALLVAVGVSIVSSVSIGQVSIPFEQSFWILLEQITGLETGQISADASGMFFDVIWEIRFPRVLLAMVAGAGLALCGTVMQASVQNPLADPFILGISSGASLGATFSILLGFGLGGIIGELGVASWAFLGALTAAVLVLGLASIGGKTSSVKLILAGTVINALCGAFSNFIIYFAKNAEGIRSISFWTMGSLAAAEWGTLSLITAVVLAAALFFLFQFRVMNTMLMGEETAVTLGINLNHYRRLYMVISSVVTGVLVCTCGIIGFVGLIVPHLVRSVVGSNHKRLVPVAILFGSLFMIWTDVFARTVIPNGELPIGIVTSLLGAPVFMYMLIKKSYGFGGK
ncbi:FecCD family ABC transporter permease [Brevibacillus parabrevis]|uniref:ABC transporter n=1 Tax=Brevibacillus parabrevis TaxID=54914 RepID=A0A4Y3PM86_BREPA|nr:iron ABC transporter permease [Brevibacillus parabrevis]RNB96160.1 iron ABC transporter permease [Brevibacillus parabrevis]GEB32229.1 ABC transporter [Brevibacillus parabrevis]